MKKKIVVLTEVELDDIRREFDYQCDHDMTKARDFHSWLRRRGYHCGNDNKWFYIDK